MTARARQNATPLRLFVALGVIALITAAAVVWVQIASAAATVTTLPNITVSADTAANAAVPAYTALGNIVMTEGAAADVAVGTNVTLVLSAPANWEFQAGACTATNAGTGGGNITIASCVTTTSTITVTMTIAGTNKVDTMTIAGVNVRPTNGGGTATAANIVSSAASTVGIAGLLNGSTFGTLTMTPGAVKKLQILYPGESPVPGAPASSGKSGTPTAQTAGTAFNVTVNSVDQFWRVASSTDTVHLTSNDPNPTLAADAALVAGTKSMSVTLRKAAAAATVTASDITNGAITANTSSNLTVNPGAFAKMQLLVPGETAAQGTATGKTGTPSAATAGSAFNVTVNAVDANWNVVTSIDNVGITSSATSTYATLPASAALVAGTKTFSVTLNKVGSFTATATDITNGAMTANTSPTIAVGVGAFTKLQILMPGELADPGSATGKTGAPTARTAGTSFSVTVNAVDANWNLVNTVVDTAAISSSDTNFAPPANAGLVAGTKTFTVTMPTAGAFTLTSSDASDGSKTANTSPSTTVNAGALAKLQLLMPGETAAPGSVSGKTGTPSARTAGTSFSVTVNAVDANWNPVTSTDTVAITSTDTNGTMPINAAMVAGTKTFTVTLKTAGSFTVTATDATNGLMTANTSPATTVNAGAFAKLQILMPGEVAAPGTATGKTAAAPTARTAGTSFSVTVNGVDANWNVVSTAVDTVAVSSSDANFTPPANAALVSGTKTFTVTLTTAGSFTLTGTDVTNGAMTANTSPSTTVNAGAVSKLQILLPGEVAAPGSATGKTAAAPTAQAAGVAFNVTVRSVDANWNVVSTVELVHLASNDSNPTLAADANLVAGTKTLSVTLRQATALATVTASDAGAGAYTSNTSANLTVNPGAATKLQILLPGEVAAPGTATGKTAAAPTAQTAGSSFNVTVNSVDANWNVVSTTELVHLASNDVNPTLAADANLVAGTKTLAVTLRKASGTATVTASDGGAGGYTSNTSANLTVNAAAASKLQILLPGEVAAPGTATGKTGAAPTAQAAAVAFNVTVNSVDANWNPVSTTELVHLASNDSNPTLAADANLVGGTKTMSVTLRQATALATVTASDAGAGGYTSNTSANLTVNAGAATKLQILLPGEVAAPGTATGKTGAAPTAQTAGSSFNVTVNSVDANWNLVSTTELVHLASNDSNPTLAADANLVAGTKSLAVTLRQATALATVTASDAGASGYTTSTSANLTVNPGAATKLQILLPGEVAAPGTGTGKTGAAPTAQAAGSSFNVTVNSVDANWNVVSTTELVHLASNDPNPTLAADANLVAGTKTLAVTLRKASGTATVTASDAGAGGYTSNTSANLTVNAGAATKLQILLPGEVAAPGTATGKTGAAPTAQTAGGAFNVTVNSVDANWNVVSTTELVHLASNDSNPTLAGDANLVAGTKTLSVTLRQATALDTVTASDAGASGYTSNTSANLTVNAGAATKLQILLPGEVAAPGTGTGKTGAAPTAQTAGSSFNVTVNSVDANWNLASTTELVHLASNDSNPTLAADANLVAGTKTLGVTLRQATALATVTASDAGASGYTSNTSANLTVSAGAATKLQILLPGEVAAPGSATGKTGAAPTAQTAGGAFNVTVNSVDANWNVVSTTELVHLTSNDSNPTLAGDANLVAGTKTLSVTLAKATGTATVTASDAGAGGYTSGTSANLTINVGAFTKLQILVPGETAAPGTATGKTGSPSAQTAGSSFTATARAVDANWNLVSSVTDTVAISTSDANAAPPANAALVGGTKNFTVTLTTAGSNSVTASDATDGAKTADTSPLISVSAGAFSKLQLLMPGETAAPGSVSGKTGAPSARTAGSSFSVTVNAVDANWNPVSSTDTVAITSTDANATLPANAALVAGTQTFNVTLKTAGSATVTATDATDGAKTANTSPSTTVNAGAFAKLQILAPGETAAPGTATGKTGSPSTQTAGSAYTVTVNAVDANWNLVSSTDSVAITSSDANATLPSSAALVAGTKNFSVTLKTAGSKTVTATDATDGAKSPDTTSATTINAAGFAKLQLLMPGETADPGSATGKTGSPSARTAGGSFSVTVNAVDANWNPVSSTDTVAITSTDANATLPSSAALVAGTKTFTVTLKTAGSATVTATDSTDGAKSPDTSPSATVNTGAFTKLQILAPGETAAPGTATGKTGSPSVQTVGSAYTVTVNAVDANWNLVFSTDTVAISSNDANATLPSNAALVAGTKNFSVTLKTAGSKTVTATDATDGAKTPDTTTATTINAAGFAKLQLLLPGETAAPGTATGKTGSPTAETAGSFFTVTVNAVDANWNPVASTDTVAITSTDGNAILPSNAALVAGTKNFNVTFKTAGSRTVTATDATDGAKSPDTSPSTTVNAGSFTKLQLLVPGETAAAGTATGKTGSPSGENSAASFSVTVNAVDANWNLVSSTDTVAITSSDGAAVVPANAALVAGTKNFTVTLNTVGSRTVTATDATDGAKSPDTSPAINVIDVLPPTFDSASVDGSTLTITFNEPLGASTPAGSAFTVVRNGVTMADPTNVVVSGTTVTLTLSAATHNGDDVTVAYTQPGSNRLQDTTGNQAASFGAQIVANGTVSSAPDVPALNAPADGVTLATATPTLSATFSDTDTNNTGQITFRVCTTSDCSSVLGATFSSATGIANGADGSTGVPAGRITTDGTYYWQAEATDNTAASSAFSASRSFVVDTTSPALQTAAVNGTSLALTYGETLDAGSVPVALAYGLHVNGGSAVTPTNVSISGSDVTLTFTAGTVHNGDAVTLDYSAGAAPVRDAVHNNSVNLSGTAVTNTTASLAPDVPALTAPNAAARVATLTPSLSATFSDTDVNNTGQITFKVCTDAACTSSLGTFTSSAGVVNGTDGSANVPGGTITVDGTYYWEAKATDNTSAASAYSASRSFIVDTTGPAFASATVDGTSLVVTFDEPLNAGSTPAGSAFVVRQNGSAQASPTGVTVSGSTVTLTLATAVRNDDIVTVAYTQPGSGRTKDVAGNDAPTFSAQSVTNNTTSVAPDVPSLTSPADGATIATLTPSLHASFSDSDTNNTGRLTFRVCADSSCATVLSLFTSASGILNGGNGSASVPGGDLTVDDTYYWQAKATDNQGVNSTFSSSRSFIVDTTPPPVPTVDSGPGNASTSGKDVSFSFSDTEGSATFETQIDGLGWNTNASPKSFTNLTDGSHTFEVRAKDALGNTSSPRTRTWTVDAIAPAVPTIDSGPAAASTSGKSVSFGFSDTEGTATFEVQIDGGGYTSASSPKAYTNLADGSHTFDVRALDAYGNTSASVSRAWTVDAVAPPAPTIDSGPSAASTSGKNVSFGFSDTEGTATFEVQIDGGGFLSSPSPMAYNDLSDGSHTFDVRAVDAYGNTSTATSRTWTVDATAPPQPTIDSGPGNASTSGKNVSFAFSDTEGGATFETQIDGLGWNANTSPKSYTNLSDGSHTFEVRALDAYGNTSAPRSRTWTVDAIAPPLPSIDSGPAPASTSGKNVTFGFSDSEGTATFEVQIDGGGFSSDSSPKAYTNLSDGSHTFDVRALDAYGNVSGTTSRTWTVDAVAPPAPSIGSGPAAASTSGKDVSFGFSDSEGGSTFEVQIDNGGYTSASSPKAYTNLADGSHTFDVRALDAYGNTSASTSRTWTVDAVAPPVPSIDSGPAAASTSGMNVVFAFSDTEGTATFEVQVDGTGYSTATSPQALTNLSDGSHTFDVRSLDAYGNTSASTTRTWTVDATPPPAPSFDSGPAAASTSGKNVSFAFSDTEGSATFEAQLDGGGYSSVTSPQALTNLSDGSHTFQVRAVDAYGNTSSVSSRTWTVDAVAPPVPSIDSGPAAASTSGKNVSFGFSDTEGTATFEVQIDGGGYTSSASPKAYTNLSDGSHTFNVRALDGYGNTSSQVTRTWTVDAIAPPAPSIDSGPAAASTSGKNVSLAFSDTEGTATFEVQIDGGGFLSSTSPMAYNNLSDGSHTFQVRALDDYGNTSSVTSRTWTVDAVAPPVPSIDSGPAAASTSGTDVSFGFSDTEGTATFEVQIDGGGYTSSTSPKAYTSLADGSHTFAVRALDGYGNTSSAVTRTWTVDAIAPAVPSIDSGPAAASTSGKNVSFGFSDTEGTATFEVQIDGGGYSADTSPKAYTNLSDGSHTFNVRALDAYGNTSASVTRTWTVDAVAPAVPSIDSGPAAASTSGKNVSFGFSDTEGTATFEVQIDGGGYSADTSPKAYTNLSDGSHTFAVRAVDAYGNTSASATRTWTVDAVAPPAPSIDSGPAAASTSGTSVSFGFSDTEGTATFEVQIDGGGWGSASSPQAYAGLSDGSHTFDVRALDAYGNTSSVTSRTWTVDATAPPVPTIDSGPAAASTSGPSVSFGFSDTEGTATFECKLDGGAFVSCTDPKAYAGLSDGSHTVSFRAIDTHGNTSASVSRTWTVDAVAPAVPSIDSGPAAASTSGKNVSFGFSDTEGTATFEVQIDGGGYTGAASPKAYTNLADGAHTFDVRAVDAYGNTSSSASRAWNVDAVAPPAPSIDSGPAAASTSGKNVSFGFSDTEGTATFEVQIDGSGFLSSTSPMPYNSLSDGSHTFDVRALDDYGNTSGVTSRTWTVDAVAPPLPTIDSGPAAASTSSKNVGFGFSDTEGTATFEVQIDGGGYSASTSPKAYTNLADGSHTFDVRALDVYGNTSASVTRTWTVDAVAPPLPTIDSGPAAAGTSGKNVSFGFSDTEGTATFEVRIDGGGYTSSSSPKAYTNLADGSHTFDVRALDGYGNVSSATTRTWTVDAVAPPVPSIDSGPAAAGTSGKNVNFGFSDTEGTATFEVQIDGGGYTSSSSPKAYTNLADGSHTFDVRALDAYGNTSASTTRTWTVDAVAPPAPSIDSGPAAASTTGPSVGFTFSDTEGTATFEVQIDGSGYVASPSPVSFNNLTDGSHTFFVRALDAYGNTSSATSRTWTVDALAPPAPSIDSGPTAASTSGKNVSFTFSDTEGTATFMVQIDGGGYNAATSPKAYTNLSDGSHTFDLVAVDSLSNISPVTSRTWTVDAVAPPLPSIDSGPAAASTSGKNVSFGFSDTEGTATFEVQIDGGGYTSSASPKAYTNLTQGSHTFDLRALDGYGNTSASTSHTWTVDATAPTVSMTSPTDGANVAASVNLTASANDTGGSGLATVVFQYAPTGTSSWVTTPATWDTSGLSDGGYDLRAIATDNGGNSTTSALVTNVLVDNHAPTVTLTAAQYVNAADPASVTISATSPDTDVASVGFFECSNATASCSGGSWNLISTDTTSPFTASWTMPGSEGNRALRAVATDGSSNTGADVKNVLVDRTAPSGGSVGYTDGFTSNTSVTISSANGTDSGSGIDAGSSLLQRDESALTNGICAAFPGTWSTVSSPDTVVSGTCYRYRYRIADLAGNVTTYTSSNKVMVDTSAPTSVSLAYSAPTNAFQTGGTVYFRQGASGGFTVTATSTDPQSGVASTTYPALGAGWSHTAGDYTFNTSAVAPGGAQTVTVTNGAGLTSTASFTAAGDSAAPSGGSISYSNGFHTPSNVDLTLVDGSDGGSGVDTSTELLMRAEAPFSAGTCGSFGSFTTIVTDPALSYTDTSVVSGTCYQYAYVVFDRVGNSATYSNANVVKVDANDPTGTQNDPGLYLRGTVTLDGSAADTGGSGVASVAFQRSPAGGGVWTTIGTDTTLPYSTSFDTTTAATPDGLYDFRVLVADGAGNTATSAVVSTRRIDNTAPLGTLTNPGQYLRATATLASSASDGGSGVASTVYQYSSAGLNTWTTTPVSFDTATGSTPDGLYDLRVLVTDNAGNQTIDTIANRRIDNTPPAATMGDPGSYVSGSVSLTSTSSDPGGSGIASVAFEKSLAGAGSYTAVAATWNTTPADDNLYDLRVVVTDNAGNVATSAPRTNVRVDNTAPLVSITSPAASSNVTGLVNIATSSSDTGGSGVDTVTLAYAVHGSGSWTTTPASWDTNALTDGVYDLRAIATDRAGNATTSATIASITVDNQNPTVSFTVPTAGQYVNAASPDPKTLSATAGDAGSGVASVEFFRCSNTTADCAAGSWTSLGAPDTTAPYNTSWTIPADGNRALKVVATDNVGHTSSDVLNVTVDRTAPDTTILTKPADPSNLATPQFTFSSNEGGSTFECKLDTGAWGICATPNTLATLVGGTHTYSVRATDPAGNTDASVATWTWLADLTAPTGTLANPGANVRGTVTLSGTSADPGGANASGVASLVYQYSTDGSTWVSTPAAWDTLGPPAVDDGTYQVHIVVTDNAGNVFTSPAITNIRVDNTVPTTSMDDPGANLRGTKSLTAAASDTGSGVAQVDFQASAAGVGAWASVGVATTSPYGVSVNTNSLSDGLYDFRTVATDVAGNVVYGAPVTNRRVDNTAPAATMGNPGSPLRSSVTLTSTTADTGGSGVASIQYQASRNGGAYLPVSALWNTAGSGDGTYALRVVATDVAGNQTTSAAVSGIVVDNTAPSTTDNAPAGWQNSAVTVTLSATDAGSGVSTTRYSLDGGAWSTGTSVNVPAADGAHTIAYYSVDVAGNIESQKSATVLVQASGPTCPTCTAADYLRDVVPLSAAPTTTGAPITSVEFLYDTTSIGVDTTAPYSASWDTTAVADGTYDLNVIVTDAASNVSAIDLGNKVVDNTLPSASVGAPLAGTLVTGSVSFSATASDAHLASVDYYVNGSQIGSTTGGPVTWDTTSVADGSAALHVVATDRSGNSRTSANVFVTVDNLPPTISLIAPSDGSGTVTLTANASADTTSVEFQRRSGAGPWTPMVTDNSAPFQASFDTTTVADGSYDLRAIATDGAAHTTATAAQPIVIDNTLPSGSLATPVAGATVGGTVSFTANATDATSGVATVSYGVRTTGSVSFTTVGSASSAPWTVAWPTAGLTTGSYDVQLVITDRAGNVFNTAPVTLSVDATPPGVQLENLPATVTGTIALHASTSGQGATRVVFGVSPAGSGRWVELGTATGAPWSASFDTTTVADGAYDFRATVYDSVGNSATSVQTNVVIDNSAPTLVSSTPADGAILESVTSLQLVASETLSSIASPLIDGNAAPAPVISGTTATFNLGSLATGLHTLSGRLVDTAGKSTPFLLHVTVQPAGTPPSAQASVEKNATRGQTTTLTTADGGITVRMPAAAWPATGGDTGDWIVLRIDPSGATANLGMTGFESLSPVYDVTARWAVNGNHLHTGFGRELVLEIPDPTGKALPVTSDGGGVWRLIPPLPASANGRLLPEMQDAFYRDRGNIEILSRHLTPFALVRDVQAPTAPTDIAGTFSADGLTVNWTPGVDNSNVLGPAILYADGRPLETVAGGATSTTVGLATATDGRKFNIVQTDGAGNASTQSKALIVLPDLTGMSVEQARATLLQRGFTIGSVTATSSTNVEPGKLVSPTRGAVVEGAPVDLVFSGNGAQTKLAFSVVGTRTVKASQSGHIAVRMNLSKLSAVAATLYSPRGKSLKVWHFTLSAGVSIRTLKLPPTASTPGRYRLVWVARSGKEKLSKTITVEVVGSAKPAAKNQPIDVVLVGDSAMRSALAISLHSSNARVLTTAEENATFLLAGNPALNIQAVVVDVDLYTLSMVHDLRTVFPNLPIVALTNDPQKLSRSVAAGATVALPRSTPPDQLAKVVRRLISH